MENERFGITRPYDARITWIYNERVPTFEKELPQNVRNLIGSKEFSRFPHYRTFMENGFKIIDLSEKQVNMLSHLSFWNVLHNADGVFLK